MGRTSRLVIALADDLAAPHRAARHQHEHATRVVVAAALGAPRVDLRCPAEFAGDHDRCRFEQSLLGKPVQQGRQADIQRGQLLGLELGEVVLVRIPAAQRNTDKPHARLDKPRRQQAALAERIGTERFGELRRFLADVERLASPLRGDDRIGLLAKAIEPREQLAFAFHRGERLIQILQQILAAFHLVDRQAVAQRDAPHRERLARLRSGVRVQRRVLHAEEAGPLRTVRHRHERRQLPGRFQLLRHDRAVARVFKRRQRAVAAIDVDRAQFVGGQGVRDAAENRELVSAHRQFRQVLADFNAFDVRLNRIERAAVFGRRVRL